MRKLGKANIKINKIGFGGIPIQRVKVEDVRAMIDEMLFYGINFIDTARGYTTSEEYIGRALKGRRDKFVLATKSMARDYKGMKKDIKLSLKNLQTDYIDLYQCHNVGENEDYSGAIEALKEARNHGIVKHIGVTSHSYDFIDKLLRTETIFETIQFPYNLIETKAYKLFTMARKKDIGVIVMKPLAGGAIDNANIALKYIINNQDISVVIPGMANIQEVKENSQVKEGEFTEAELEYIEEIRNKLNEDFCRRCGYCLPCKVGINIPSVFLFEGYYKRYNLKNWAVSRYQTLNVKPEACIECGDCEIRCPYNLNIIDKLKSVSEVFNKGMNNG